MKRLFPPNLTYLENLTLNFSGCKVTITKSEDNKYSISISPGDIDFNCTDASTGILYTPLGYVAYVDLPYHVSTTDKFKNPDVYNNDYIHIYEKYAKYDWFIYHPLTNGFKYFTDGDVFSVDDVNIILQNIKYGVDFLEFVRNHKVGRDSYGSEEDYGNFLSGKYEREK